MLANGAWSWTFCLIYYGMFLLPLQSALCFNPVGSTAFSLLLLSSVLLLWTLVRKISCQIFQNPGFSNCFCSQTLCGQSRPPYSPYPHTPHHSLMVLCPGLRREFLAIDTDRNGWISTKEFWAQFRAFNIPITKEVPGTSLVLNSPSTGLWLARFL